MIAALGITFAHMHTCQSSSSTFAAYKLTQPCCCHANRWRAADAIVWFPFLYHKKYGAKLVLSPRHHTTSGTATALML